MLRSFQFPTKNVYPSFCPCQSHALSPAWCGSPQPHPLMVSHPQRPGDLLTHDKITSSDVDAGIDACAVGAGATTCLIAKTGLPSDTGGFTSQDL